MKRSNYLRLTQKDTASRAALAPLLHSQHSDMMSARRRAATVSLATRRAAVTPVRAPGSWWVGVTRDVSPLPPVSSSVWAGPSQERASETRHPRGTERGAGGRRAARSGVEWSGALKSLRRSTGLLSNLRFWHTSSGAFEAGLWERCGRDGGSSYRTVSQTTWRGGDGVKGCSVASRIRTVGCFPGASWADWNAPSCSRTSSEDPQTYILSSSSFFLVFIFY